MPHKTLIFKCYADDWGKRPFVTGKEKRERGWWVGGVVFFFLLFCQESQFPSVGLMHYFISNSVGFAREQLSETTVFNAE